MVMIMTITIMKIIVTMMILTIRITIIHTRTNMASNISTIWKKMLIM